jgi:hypothetical protein
MDEMVKNSLMGAPDLRVVITRIAPVAGSARHHPGLVNQKPRG